MQVDVGVVKKDEILDGVGDEAELIRAIFLCSWEGTLPRFYPRMPNRPLNLNVCQARSFFIGPTCLKICALGGESKC